MTTTRGTTNGSQRGNTETRRRRRAWLVQTYASDLGWKLVRCYRCGTPLFNPDDYPEAGKRLSFLGLMTERLTIDRIIPGVKGGTYRYNNIRPACGGCNSETGGALRGTGRAA